MTYYNSVDFLFLFVVLRVERPEKRKGWLIGILTVPLVKGRRCVNCGDLTTGTKKRVGRYLMTKCLSIGCRQRLIF